MDAKNTLSRFVPMTLNIETTYKACVPIEDVNRETKNMSNEKWQVQL